MPRRISRLVFIEPLPEVPYWSQQDVSASFSLGARQRPASVADHGISLSAYSTTKKPPLSCPLWTGQRSPLSNSIASPLLIRQSQNHRTVRGDCHGMLKVSRQLSIRSYGRPVVRQSFDFVTPAFTIGSIAMVIPGNRRTPLPGVP